MPLVQLVLLDQQGPLAHQVQEVKEVNQDHQELVDHEDHQVREALLGLVDPVGQVVHQEAEANLVHRVRKVCEVKLDQLVHQAQEGQEDSLGHQAVMASKEKEGSLEHLGLLDPQDLQGMQVLRDNKVRKDKKETGETQDYLVLQVNDMFILFHRNAP